jgi:hypothetical protein
VRVCIAEENLMGLSDQPDDVLPEENEATKFVGYNCVACVAAVLHNEMKNTSSFATANLVASKYQIAPSENLLPSRAVAIFVEFAGVKVSPGNPKPWDAGMPDGHYAVFSTGAKRHVVYAYKEGPGHYVYDPQTRTKYAHVSHFTKAGFGPLECYHFT